MNVLFRIIIETTFLVKIPIKINSRMTTSLKGVIIIAAIIIKLIAFIVLLFSHILLHIIKILVLTTTITLLITS